MKGIKKFASVLLALLMVVSVVGVMPTNTDAAIKVLTGKKATISVGESYGIATLTKGVKYTSSNSKVASVNSKGTVKAKKAGKATIKLSSSSGTASVAITVTPKKVTSVKAAITSSTDTKSNVKVSWKKAKGASGYIVYRSTKKSSGYKAVKTIKKGSTTNVTFKNLAGGATYYFKVKAYTKSGKKKILSSEFSNVASVKLYKLVWSDEFNTNALDTSVWQFETGTGDNGWGNQELQNYTAGDNVKVENGNLVIIPRLKWNTTTNSAVSATSTRIMSKGTKEFQYGKIEIRAKATKGKGSWSAGWMLGNGTGDSRGWPYDGEIDILESMDGGVPQTIHCEYWNNQSWSHGNKNYSTGLTQAIAAQDYHTYGVIWTDSTIEFTVDGRTTGIVDMSKYSASIRDQIWAFDHPFFFIFNCAVGGNAAGVVSTDGWTQVGTEGNIATYEDYFYVDYVRVYQ